jgi:6-phosphogluconolactonase
MSRPSLPRWLRNALLAAAVLTLSACNGSFHGIFCSNGTTSNCCQGTSCGDPGSVVVAAGNQILRFSLDPDTGALELTGSVTTANSVGGIVAPLGSKFVYAVDGTQSAILGFTSAGTDFTAVPGSPFSGIDGQARPASDGRFLYMPGSSGQGLGVYAIGPQGGLAFLNPVPGVQQSSTPFFTAVVPLNPRFVYTSNSAAVPGEIEAAAVAPDTGVISGVPGSPLLLAPNAGPPGAIAQAGNRFVFVLLPAANSVAAFAIDMASGALAPVPGSPFPTGHAPSALAVDPSGTHLYVTNESDGTVSAFAISSTGVLNPVPGSPFAAGAGPVGVAVDSRGHLYVANGLSNDISAYSIVATGSSSGALTPIPGSPFPVGTQPNAITIGP